MLGRQFLDLIVLLVLQLFDEILPEVFHLGSHLLHLEIVFFLEIVGAAFELLSQLCLSLIVFGLECEGVIFL